MSLADMIRGRVQVDSGNLPTATVTLATPATDTGLEAGTVAKVATVTVATAASEADGRWWHWLVTFSDCPALDVAYGSRVTRAEVLADHYPDATGAEPIPDAPRTPARGRSISEVVRGVVAARGLSCDVEGVIAEIEAWPPDDHTEMLADAALAEAAVRSVAERWLRRPLYQN